MSSSSLLNESDIKAIKNKNYRLIFVIGIPGCNKGSQTEKISNEFKYPKISMRNIIMKEVASNSEIGKQIYELKSNDKPLPSEIVVSLLINNLKNCESKTVIIDGFPNRLDDAIYFEQKIVPIELIIKLNSTEETCLKNLAEAGESIKPEELRKIYETRTKEFDLLEDFYSTYSIIRDVDINNSNTLSIITGPLVSDISSVSLPFTEMPSAQMSNPCFISSIVLSFSSSMHPRSSHDRMLALCISDLKFWSSVFLFFSCPAVPLIIIICRQGLRTAF